jgi:hypothetical protein
MLMHGFAILEDFICRLTSTDNPNESNSALQDFLLEPTNLPLLYDFVLTTPAFEHSSHAVHFIFPALRQHWACLSNENKRYCIDKHFQVFSRQTALDDIRIALSVIRHFASDVHGLEFTSAFDRIPEQQEHQLLLASCPDLCPLPPERLLPFLMTVVPTLLQGDDPADRAYLLARAMKSSNRQFRAALPLDLLQLYLVGLEQMPAVSGHGPDIFWRELFNLAEHQVATNPQIAEILLRKCVEISRSDELPIEARWTPLWGLSRSIFVKSLHSGWIPALFESETSVFLAELLMGDGSVVTPRSGLIESLQLISGPMALFSYVLRVCVLPALDGKSGAEVLVACDYLASAISICPLAIESNLTGIFEIMQHLWQRIESEWHSLSA